MRDTSTEKYLSGAFLAKFRGKLTGKDLKSGQSFTVQPYHGELSEAVVLEGLVPAQFAEIPLMELPELKDVSIHFKNPADPRYPHFKEDIKEVVLTGFSIEQVMREGDTMHGMIRGQLYAPLYRGIPVPTPKNVEIWQKEAAELAKRFNLSAIRINPAAQGIEPEVVAEPLAQPMLSTEPNPISTEEKKLETRFTPPPAVGNVAIKAKKEASEKVRYPQEAVTHTGRGLILTVLLLFSALLIFGLFAVGEPTAIWIFGGVFAACFGLSFIRPLRTLALIAWAIGQFAAFILLLLVALGLVG